MYSSGHRRAISSSESHKTLTESKGGLSGYGHQPHNSQSNSQLVSSSQPTPYIKGRKNPQFTNPSYMSDSSLTNLNYPDSTKHKKLRQEVSPFQKKLEFRRKQDIALKIGTLEHTRTLIATEITPQKQSAKSALKNRDLTPQPARKLEFDIIEAKEGEKASATLKPSQTPGKDQEKPPLSTRIVKVKETAKKQETPESRRDTTPEKLGPSRWGSRKGDLDKSLENYASAPQLNTRQYSSSPGKSPIYDSIADQRSQLKVALDSPLKQEKHTDGYYNDEFTKPFSLNATNAPHSIHQLKKKKQDVALKVTEQSFDLKPVEVLEKKLGISVEPERVEEIVENIEATAAKDIDSQSDKSDALLCDTCVNDLLIKKKQEIQHASGLADQVLRRQAQQDLAQIAADQEWKVKAMKAKERALGLDNKRIIEENRLNRLEARAKDAAEVKKELEEVERSRVDSLERDAEKTKKYREELLAQIESQKQRKKARKDADRSAIETGLRIDGGGYRRTYSQGDLRRELQNQIQDKVDERNLDKFKDKKKERQQLEEMTAKALEEQRLAAEKEHAKKEELRRALQEEIEEKKRAKEREKQEKLRERDAIDSSVERLKENEQELSRKKRKQIEAMRQGLINQMQENKDASFSSEKRVEEEFTMMGPASSSPDREREKKSQYREDLLDQMSANKDRKLREKSAGRESTGTGLDVGSGYRNTRVPSQREINEELLNQMTDREMDRVAKKAQEKERLLEQVRRQREQQEEAARERAEKDQEKKMALRNALLEEMEEKQKAKEAEKRQREKEKQNVDEAMNTLKTQEEEILAKKRLKQAEQRNELINQIEDDRIRRKQQEIKEREQQDDYILETTQFLDKIQKDSRDQQIRERQALAYKIGIPPTNEKYKLQMRYEREPSPFEKRHADVNNRVPSPEKVREELLDQINEKKLNEWHENARSKSAQREYIEKLNAEQVEAYQRKVRKEKEKKNELREALQDTIERKEIEKEEAWKSKTKEGQAIKDAIERQKEAELIEQRAKEEGKRRERAAIVDQIQMNKQRKEQERSQEREKERELLEQSLSHSPPSRREREKQSQYREELLHQIEEKKRSRERRPEEGASGLFLNESYRNERVPSPSELRDTLARQMIEKKLEKANEREREKYQFNKILEVQAEQEEETHRQQLEQERKKREAVRQEIAGYLAEKDEKKNAKKREKEQERKAVNDSVNGIADAKRKDSYSRIHEKRKEYVEGLKNQLLEKSALKQREMENKRTPYLASLPVKSQEVPNADCDGCHKTYPKTRLTNKKKLRL